jgi:CheY-like chemotaxis protein
MEDLKKIPKQMLVVDDEKSLRDLLAEYLNGCGYGVTCGANGQDALQIYKPGHFGRFSSDRLLSIRRVGACFAPGSSGFRPPCSKGKPHFSRNQKV